MKKILYLIMASLLVLGVVLAGCAPAAEEEEEEEENFITFAVCGPLTFIQGQDHVGGAELARDEINAAGGVDVGGTSYQIKLITVDTNEIADTSGATGTTALTAVIDNVDFVVGGFRTEAVTVYREVAMDAQKIFIDDGAASNELQESVLLDYDNYKYWFKGTPYNGTFLFYNMLKQVGLIAAQLKAATNVTQVTAACIVEDAEWTGGFKQKLAPYLTAVVGLKICAPTQLPASDSSNLEAELTAITSACGGEPMITVTVLSGPPGKAYGIQQPTYLPHTFTAGINVEAQDINYHDDTGAMYHCEMDTWVEDTEITPGSRDWFNDYVAETGRYPSYCAATYDSIKTLVAAIEDVGGFTSAYTDAIIAWMEDLDNAQTGVGAKTGYYPMPELGPFPGEGPSSESATGYTNEWYALSAAQAYAIYGDGLLAYYKAKYPTTITSKADMEANWDTGLRLMTGFGSSAHLTSYLDNTGAHLPHDTIYGVGWQTGQGAQWQPDDPANLAGHWSKVGWWPMIVTSYGANKAAVDLTPQEAAILYGAKMLDQWGNWNFKYPGSVPLVIPQDYIAHWRAA